MRWHDCIVHGKAMSSLKLGTLGAKPPPQSPQLATKESTVEERMGDGWGLMRYVPPQRGGSRCAAVLMLEFMIVITFHHLLLYPF